MEGPSPLTGLADGQYWIVVEVENAAGDKTRVGGLVYVDKTAPESDSPYLGDPDIVELSVDGSAENIYGYVDRGIDAAVPRWSLHPQLDFEEPSNYGHDNVGLPEPDPITVTLEARDYAGNHRSWDHDASCMWAADDFQAVSAFYVGGQRHIYYVGLENGWFYDYGHVGEACGGNGYMHFTEGGSFDFTYSAWDFWGDMVPGTIGVRIDGVVSPSGAGIVPAPPAWPVDGQSPKQVEVSLVGDFLHCGLSDPTGGYGGLRLSSYDYPNYLGMTVASGGQATEAGDGSGPGGVDIVSFEGEWVSDDYYSGDAIHRQAAGWERVYAYFYGYSAGNDVDVYLDTDRPGFMNVVRAGPRAMASGSRGTLRVVAGGLEDVDPADVVVVHVEVGVRANGCFNYFKDIDVLGLGVPKLVPLGRQIKLEYVESQLLDLCPRFHGNERSFTRGAEVGGIPIIPAQQGLFVEPVAL